MADSAAEGSLISDKGLSMAPRAGAMEPAYLAGQRKGQVLNLSQRVLDTIAEARVHSNRDLYSLKWKVFVPWCTTRNKYPANCDVSVIVSAGLLGFWINAIYLVYVVNVDAISAFRLPISDRSVRKHNLVMGFLRGTWQLYPSHPQLVSVWDLSLVRSALSEPPF